MKGQIEVRLSFHQATYTILKTNAKRLGVPVTQYLKHIIFNELEGRTALSKPEQEDTSKADEDDLDRLIESVRRVKLRLNASKSIRKRRVQF